MEKVKFPWTEIRAWWKSFVKRHIVDDDPYQDESHSATRYAQDDYIDWTKVPKGYKWIAVDYCLEPPTVFAYKGKPRVYSEWCPEDTTEGWRDMDGTCYPIGTSAIIGPLPPWRESLRKRPE